MGDAQPRDLRCDQFLFRKDVEWKIKCRDILPIGDLGMCSFPSCGLAMRAVVDGSIDLALEAGGARVGRADALGHGAAHAVERRRLLARQPRLCRVALRVRVGKRGGDRLAPQRLGHRLQQRSTYAG
ncbi:hypothetical protein KFE25_000589 [Diacronema lutheri]|uniref:Uncharacterized protein n=1 Tax=Diacronema lutheri TaxID=2081491 RepID=A0A8J6CH16_DIALT|nr:hypothetical protein KFE25_000589 [Diacronema lutheri]